MKRRHRAPAVAADAPTPVVVASSGRPACPRRNPSDGPACVASHPPLAARPALAARSFFPQPEQLLGRTTSAHGRCSMYCLYPYMCKFGPCSSFLYNAALYLFAMLAQ